MVLVLRLGFAILFWVGLVWLVGSCWWVASCVMVLIWFCGLFGLGNLVVLVVVGALWVGWGVGFCVLCCFCFDGFWLID